ncbi:MAG: glutamate-5-semialdehyde dehydrogenase [Proteobacteria bacterium]|nr:glutamate-5-semialdehyde dehydrogenase [Pseudomonadota bacterium]
MNILECLKKTKNASYGLALLSEAKRNVILTSLAGSLLKTCDKTLDANAKDLANIDKHNPMYDRLLLNESRIKAIAEDVKNVANLPSPLSKRLEHKVMPNGLNIEKISVPLGVIGIIYEARPNVTIDAFALCFKSGNAVVLKGGKEAYHSNLIFVEIIQKCLKEHDVDVNSVYLFPPSREETHILLQATGLVDVCIPRGSQSLIDFVRQNAKIPVIETGAGIVHTYFDASGDLKKGRDIINNAKTRRVSVCNALDCLLIHKERINDLYSLVEPLQNHNVEIFADVKSYEALKANYNLELLHTAKAEDFGREFLSYKLAVKVVDSIDEAMQHIIKHTSSHSEAIITEDIKSANSFIEKVDAAVVYVNASTAFTDGGQFGMGAEIGISTQKLHARGPMGLEALTSYKWVVHGNGQVRG